MCFVYVGIGFFLLTAERVLKFSSLQKNVAGIILILYGLFRSYNAFKKWKEDKDEENDE